MSCSLWLELTPYCNLNCSFCYNPWRGHARTRYPGRDGIEWVTVIDRLGPALQFAYVALSGGEPLLVSELEAIVGRLTEFGQTPIVTTNGRSATERRLKALASAGLKGVQVPLLAVTPELHDRLSGGPSWHWAMRSVLVARALDLTVGLTFVATAENVGEFPRIVDLASKLGIGAIMFNEVHLEGKARGKHALRPTASASMAALKTVDRMGLATLVHIRPSSEELRAAIGVTSSRLDEPWHRIAVDPSGSVKLCNLSTKVIGNIHEMDCTDLAYLIEELRAGKVGRYRDSITNCACLADRVAKSGALMSAT